MAKISKGTAFILGMCCIGGMFVVMIVLHIIGKSSDFPIGVFLTAFVGLPTTYMGIDVANNAARGKFFNPEIPKLDAMGEIRAQEQGNEGDQRK